MLLIKDMKTIFPAHDMLIYVGLSLIVGLINGTKITSFKKRLKLIYLLKITIPIN